ncbi:GNAT family N-acetyltransferase [Streptomyces sp. J2-1]|uniref:GNAT family N-acetyltransferase n=1 Tax=Streptomyces corallincola TaxID=2851888 RepID=UPI001C388E63|nr:GNAT family N-acetyltransferase [Streptomyces corallincola]MBV2353939.1 GNAT family N-acetyltransferase [Streptomyces corallincola]
MSEHDEGRTPPIHPTRRLDFLPLRVDHAEEMTGVLSDPRLHEFIGGTPYDVAQLRARYERLTAGSPRPGERWLNWVLHLRTEGRLVGTVQATVLPCTAELAWIIGTPWQGRGLASEAAKALATALASDEAHRTLTAHIHPSHHASQAVARAAGLTPTEHWHDGELRWGRGPLP